MKEKRDTFIKIRCTHDERESWNRAAKIAEKTLSNIVRESFDAEQTKIKKTGKRIVNVSRSDPKLLREINSIGVNINQMARTINKHKDAIDALAVCVALNKLNETLLLIRADHRPVVEKCGQGIREG